MPRIPQLLEPKIKEYNDLLSYNHIFVRRTANVGIISEQAAIDYAISGPCLRGSGIHWDLRKVQPYSSYDDFDFDIPVGVGHMGHVGDSWDRYFVRILEMTQSVRIIRQALDRLPAGSHRVALPRVFKVPPGEVYTETEAARGQLGFYIESQGGPIPFRVKVRGPSFCNLSITGDLCKDCLLADVPAIIGSIDVVMGEVDR